MAVWRNYAFSLTGTGEAEQGERSVCIVRLFADSRSEAASGPAFCSREDEIGAATDRCDQRRIVAT